MSKTIKLAIPLLLFISSAAVVGIEVLAPILTDDRVSNLIPARRLLDSWLISIFALGVFAYNLGKQDGASPAKGGAV